MKYPKLKATWTIADNDDVTKQIVKIYGSSDMDRTDERLMLSEDVEPFIYEFEFFIPAWDFTGRLIEANKNIRFTVQAITDNFPSMIVESNMIELQDISVESPSGAKLEMLPFPDFYKEIEIPLDDNDIIGSGVI